jgi:hypothetical protein
LAKVNNKNQWTWIPCQSIGNFNIGVSIFDYMNDFHLIEVEEYRKSLWKDGYKEHIKFSMDENEFLIPQYDFSFIIYTKKYLIEYFQIETYLYYNGHDIIYSSLEDVLKIINRSSWDKKDSLEIDNNIQHIYYFYDMGLTLWTLDGKVVTAFCDDGKIWMKDDNEI